MARLPKGVGERQGVLAHDEVDDSNPMKIGGHASSVLPTSVSTGDIADLSCDLAGRLRVLSVGDVDHDDPDSGNPLKIGGWAAAFTPGAVDNGDRVNAFFTITGGQVMAGVQNGGTPRNLVTDVVGNLHVAGNVVHDGADSGNPIKVGARGTAAPYSAVNEGDRVDLSADLQGRVRTIAVGPVADGAADAGDFPVKVGAVGTLAAPANADDGDVVDLSATRQGVLRVSANSETAHSFVDGGGPVKVGGRALSTLGSAVTTGDRTDAIYTLTGGAIVAGVSSGTPTNLSTTSVGGLHVVSPSGTSLNIEGDTPHDGADAGDPVKIGGIANASAPAAVGEDDRVNASFDLTGALRITGGSSGGTSAVDNSGYTGGSTSLTPMGALFDASPPTITDGSIGAPLMSSGRILLSEPGGNVAHDAVDAGNPIKIGGKAYTNLPTVVGNADRVDALFLKTGALVVGGVDADGTTLRELVITGAPNELHIGGGLEHDAVDGSTRPIKIGGKSNTTLPTVASAFRRVNACFNTYGALLTCGLDPNGSNLRNIGIQATGAVLMNGDVAHDAADDGYPIKIGGIANVAAPAAVAENDRVNASFDLTGALRTTGGGGDQIVVGNVAHDGVDSGNPVKIGGIANVAAPSAVGENDRVNASFDLTGALRTTGGGGDQIVVGNVAHDAADSGDPVKIGGIANVAAPSAVGENDRVNASFDLTGALRTTGGGGDQIVVGGVVHGGADADAPVKIGGRIRTSVYAALTQDEIGDMTLSSQGGVVLAAVNGTFPTELHCNSLGALAIHGAVGSGTADSQNPIKVGGRATAALEVAVDEDDVSNLSVDLQGQLRVLATGNVAHDAADAGNPVGIGLNAAEFNADPPQVSTDGDRVRALATPQGIQWTLGGHPNIIRREYMTTAVQTVDAIIDTVAAGSQIVVTAVSVMVSAATSTTPAVRLGFGTTAPPTEPTTGNTVDDMLLSHPGIAAGSGVVEGNGSSAIAVGGDGNELRIACDVPTGGQITVMVSYYISSL
jgi:hypothetical protein